MHKKLFDRFIQFGLIADDASREKIASSIFSQLQNTSRIEIELSNVDTDNFYKAIAAILSNPKLQELCSIAPGLEEELTQEILDFITKTKKLINKTESPFEKETELLSYFIETTENDFEKHWETVKLFIESTYDNDELDTDFYEKEFKISLTDEAEKDKEAPDFESVKEHFTEKWKALLFQKKMSWELDLIEEQRKLFCAEFYKQIEDFEKLQEELEPITNELGRFWDMSKGNWKKSNLDVLKKYAALLEKESSIKILAEMLGKMRNVEREFEEELITQTHLKPQWRVEHANKADLIGVCESDDLSSLLPSETALLADYTLQYVFFKKFAEKKLQTFEYRAKVLSFQEAEIQKKREKEKEESKGPFIICVDTSGSMHGTPEAVAKTFCFALLKIAIKENRKCYLISFSTGIETLDLGDLKNSLDRILSFLSMSFHGGTDASPALNEALRQLETNDYRKADVLMISDFVMPFLGENTKAKILMAKENKTKFHSLVIGSGQNQKVIDEFDHNWFYDPNNKESMLILLKNLKEIQAP